MISIPKFVGLLSCGAVLCMGLSHNALAANELSGAADHQKNDQMKGAPQSEAGKTIKGEVVRVEGDNYFVKGQDGKEVRLQVDPNTQTTGTISQGDRIEAKVNDQNRALSIRSTRGTDAGHGNEMGRTPDSTNELGKPGSSGSMGR
jgi:hypothetical protein